MSWKRWCESEPHKQDQPSSPCWARLGTHNAFVASYRALLGMFLVHRHDLYSVLEYRGQYLRRLEFRCVPPYDAFLLQTYIYFVVQHLNTHTVLCLVSPRPLVVCKMSHYSPNIILKILFVFLGEEYVSKYTSI